MAERKSAKDAVDSAYVHTHVTHVTEDLSSTDGIRRAIQANTVAIRLLADHIDGVYTDPVNGERKPLSGKVEPVKTEPVTKTEPASKFPA